MSKISIRIFFALVLLLATVTLFSQACFGGRQEGQRRSIAEIIETVKKQSGVVWPENTVDTFKAGDPKVEVTGIATTFLATFEVLQKAKEKGLNLIITHEPTFYNHLDDLSILENDKIQAAKKKFIEDNGLVVWRFHDNWHRMQPDGVMEGMKAQLGWNKNLKKGETAVFEFPETKLKDFADMLSKKYGTTSLRIIGSENMKFTTVGTVWGAAGSNSQIRMLQRDDVEVLIVGETREWETVEYARDAVTMGTKKALIILGHANSEEAGMDYCADWLKGFVNDVPVEFVPAGDPFWEPKK